MTETERLQACIKKKKKELKDTREAIRTLITELQQAKELIKKLQEFVKDNQYQESPCFCDCGCEPTSFCVGCGAISWRECKPYCEVQNLLKGIK